MNPYPKIQTVFKRNLEATGRVKPLLFGQWTYPEFEYLQHLPWRLTEKVDGTNIRVMLQGGALDIRGREEESQTPEFLRAALIDLFAPKMGAMSRQFDGDFCLYGEGYGPKIQKGGGNYRDTPGFVLFDVRVGPWWLKREDVEKVASALGLDVVPVLGQMTLWDAMRLVSSGLMSQWGDFRAEGVVTQPAVDLLCRNGQRIMTKIKTVDFFGKFVEELSREEVRVE